MDFFIYLFFPLGLVDLFVTSPSHTRDSFTL